MINVTTKAFVADPDRFLEAAANGEPVRIARPGGGAMVLVCGGAYNHLYVERVKSLSAIPMSPQEVAGWQAELDTLDNEN